MLDLFMGERFYGSTIEKSFEKINNFLITKFRVRIIGGSVCEYEIPNYYCIRFIDHWYSTKY